MSVPLPVVIYPCVALRYNSNLSEARDKGIRKGLILGLSMGATWFVVYAAYSLGFWYGAKLIREDDTYTPGRLLIVSRNCFLDILFTVMYGDSFVASVANTGK